MSLYRKKPVIVEAMQLTPLSIDEAEAFVGGDAGTCPEHARSTCLVIATLEGPMHASMSDWIIKGVKGEFYPCKSDIFEATYERVADDDGTAAVPEVRGDEAP